MSRVGGAEIGCGRCLFYCASGGGAPTDLVSEHGHWSLCPVLAPVLRYIATYSCTSQLAS